MNSVYNIRGSHAGTHLHIQRGVSTLGAASRVAGYLGAGHRGGRPCALEGGPWWYRAEQVPKA